MKKLVLSLALVGFGILAQAQFYTTTTGKVSFYSKTPVEDIKAENNMVMAILKAETNELAIAITNTSFNFENKLMQEHFNEKYMESDKFPKSSFKGKINETIDYTKDGEYKVTATGILNIHGVEQNRTISGTLIIKDGKVQLKSNFKVKVADHKITIPTIVTAKIAEEIEVTVDMILIKKEKS
jgi:polyisoprenoid-binding protein YceI